MTMRNLLLLIISICCVNVFACLNDSDTRTQILSKKDPESILLGLFFRYPDEYYQARIDRLNAVRLDGKLTFPQYDDLAVAFERLGDTDKALEVINQKEDLMMKVSQDDPRLQVEGFEYPANLTAYEYMTYTTFANKGTFMAHKWLNEGRKKEDFPQAEKAIEYLKKSVEVNPDAHSGREWVQIDILAWIMAQTKHHTGKYRDLNHDRDKAVEGLLGLIELGSAWNSIDVYRMINQTSLDPIVDDLSERRAQQLLKEGKKPLFWMAYTPSAGSPEGQLRVDDAYLESVEKAYQDSERINKEFQDYVLAGIKDGKHPDTDPNFFEEFDGFNQELELKVTLVGRDQAMNRSFRALPGETLGGDKEPAVLLTPPAKEWQVFGSIAILIIGIGGFLLVLKLIG